MKKLLYLLLILTSSAKSQMMFGISGLLSEQNRTQFGVLVNSTLLTNSQKANVSYDTLGARYVRGALTCNTWTGSSTRYETYRTKFGLGNQIPVINSRNGTAAYPKTAPELAGYADTLGRILDKYTDIKMVVIENEALNTTFHPADNLAEYSAVVAAAYPVCKARGVKMIESGVYGSGLDGLTYRWLVSTYGSTTANLFGNIAFTPAQLTNIQNFGSNANLENNVLKVDTILNLSSYFDYMNIHLYEVYNPNITNDSDIVVSTQYYLRYIKEYIETRTHKPCITNETGQRYNVQPGIVTSVLQQYYSLGFRIVQWFSGEDGSAGSNALNNDTTGAIKPNGTAFKNFIISKR